MYYQTEKAGEEEWKVGQRAIKEGLKVENLSKAAVQKIEKNIDLNIKGAVYYHSDAHTTPNEFMPQLKTYLKKNGVSIFGNEEVLDIDVKNDKIAAIKTTNLKIKADEFVIATGSWSQNLAKKIGINIPVQAGKGYRINTEKETGISIPAILCEAKVAVTPMNGFTRFAGTMEIAGINQNINKVRVETIANAAKKYYPSIELTQEEKNGAASGLRPVSPDGLPYIGKSTKCENLTIATGHAMMGWTMATATGKLVSEITSEQKTSLEITNYHPDRKF